MAHDKKHYERFENLDFEGFRQLAKDSSLTPYEKIGFPNEYREGYEPLIFADIVAKLPRLNETNQVILDIGPGCSELPRLLIEQCRHQGHTLILVDSQEMLDQLLDEPFIIKVAGFYPRDCAGLIEQYQGKIDVILTYSVLHYVFVETSIFDFIDKSLSMLKHAGQMLIGDIPNVSKRKRFFSAPAGVAHHQAFTGTDEIPPVVFNHLETSKIDDAVVLSLLMRYRAAGFDAYVLAQGSQLPMANRREDILICKP
jgi:hypothetical protein